MTSPCFCGHWARRNCSLLCTQPQLIVITGVEDLPSARDLLHHQPEVCQLVRAVCNLNQNPDNLASTISRIVSIPMEFHDPLHNDPNLNPSFWHKDFLSDCTNFSHFPPAPVTGMNNQRQMIVYIESIILILPYHPVFAPPQCSALEFADIDQDQCLLPTN